MKTIEKTNKKTTVLVTGGAGYIGSHTCVNLLEQGYDIVVVDNFVNSSPISLERVTEITGKTFPWYHTRNAKSVTEQITLLTISTPMHTQTV